MFKEICTVEGLMFTNEPSEIPSMTTVVVNESHLPREAAVTAMIAVSHSTCAHTLDADIMLATIWRSRAEQTDATPRPTIPKHLPPPIHSTARHDARLEEETRHGNVSLTNSAPAFYDSCLIVLLVFFLSRL